MDFFFWNKGRQAHLLFFPLFLILLLVLGLVILYLLWPDFFTQIEFQRIPIIIQQEPDKVNKLFYGV